MTDLVFFNSPFQGHVNPTLAIARALVEQGAHVDYYLTEHFRDAVAAIEAAFHPLAVSLSFRGSPGDTLALHIAQESSRLIPTLLDEVRALQPACIVYDATCLWGRLLAHILGVPAVAIYCSYALNLHVLRLGSRQLSGVSKAADPPGQAGSSQQSFLLTHRLLEQLRARYHLPPLGNFFAHAAALNIVCVPRAFQPLSETFDERFVFIGLPVQQQRVGVDFPFASLDARPLLYISLGTVVNDRLPFYRSCLAAFGSEPWQIVLSLGERVTREELGPLPANVIVRPFVPQLAILQRASVFLTHGGTNSVMESLYHRVPLVVAPSTPEHTITGRRVAELGLGLTIEDTEPDIQALRTAVASVLHDPAIRNNVEQMSDIVRHAGGSTLAATAILQFVARHR
jgi:MGT family glycosyltransferase